MEEVKCALPHPIYPDSIGLFVFDSVALEHMDTF